MKNFNIRVENIVASANLNMRINLEKIVEYLEGTEYEPEQFPGLVYRLKDPRAAALIFSSGKIICTGARCISDVKKVVEKVVKMLKEAKIGNPKKYTIQVENIVASASFPSGLNLDKIAFELENSEYEPEQFPGLVYRTENPKAAFLLFSSGKVMCTGLRDIKEINNAVKSIFQKLRSINAFK